MASVKKTFTFGAKIWDDFSQRAKECGYPSVPAYFRALGLYDLMIRKPHNVTAGMADLPLAMQNKIEDEVSRAYRANETLGGSWFENRLNEAVKAVADGSDLPKSRIQAELLKKIAR